MMQQITGIVELNKTRETLGQHCPYCGRAMGPEIFLGSTCGSCVRRLHAEVTGKLRR
jgi:hypothetical protein